VTVEKQNIDREMKITLKELIEIAKDPKLESRVELVLRILKREDATAEIEALRDELLDPAWDPADGSWVPGSPSIRFEQHLDNCITGASPPAPRGYGATARLATAPGPH
jgi:hypothetical protein